MSATPPAGEAMGDNTGHEVGAHSADGSHLEVEVKYDADERFEMPVLVGLHGVAGVEQPATQELAATYFDTPDLRLAQAAITLRRRTGGTDAGWHLKLPKAKDQRLEVHRPLGRSKRVVPKDLATLVRAYVRDASLSPVATLTTARTVHRLIGDVGDVLVEVADDYVVGERTGATEAPLAWREVEVELVSGDASLLPVIGDLLVAAGARPASSASKLARVLGEAVVRPQRPDVAALGKSATAGDVLRAHLAEQVDAVLSKDRTARADEPDAVHKMRVATRRLRSALATYRPILDRSVTDPIRDELRWLGQVLGEPRDAEVMRDRVHAMVADEPAELVLGPVRRRVDMELAARHRDAHASMVVQLDGERYFRLLDSLTALVGGPPLRGRAKKSATKILPSLVKRALLRVLATADEAAVESDPGRRDHLLHEVRKAAKRARYAGESVAPALGDKATSFATTVEHLQEVLGEHQDSVVTRDLLRELGVQAHLAGENGFTFGRLHGLEQSRGERAIEQYDDALAAVRDRPRWLK